jgi:hypothetical protein
VVIALFSISSGWTGSPMWGCPMFRTPTYYHECSLLLLNTDTRWESLAKGPVATRTGDVGST